MRPERMRMVHAGLLLFAFALMARAAYVQLWQGKLWDERAKKQQQASGQLPAPRGTIRDATGLPLAESRELVKLSVAPKQVRNRGALRRALERASVERSWIARATDTTRQWVDLPGAYTLADVPSLLGMRGVYRTAIAERVYLPSESVRRLVGRASPEHGGLDGIELALDSLLSGTKGTSELMRDAKGRALASPGTSGDSARAGHSVTLTINHTLQEIAERALADAQARTGAKGGDIVVMDPHSGAVLAMVSRRADPRSTAATALTEPFEPGSTLKPLVAARLLTLKRARVDDVIQTYNGTYKTNGRTITDLHKAPTMTLAKVIAFSSNIGMVRFAERLAPREEYELLRDAGFGTSTGVPYPLESPGTLREPKRWSKQSPASLAMGYEIAVTPLQLAAAYAAIANGGELVAPTLVQEITTPDGAVLWQHQRRVVRRVMPPEVAAQLRVMLTEVVDDGTGRDAELTSFDVAGKSGTARRTAPRAKDKGPGKGTGYVTGSYTASFVGLFPAKDPQYVILVKLDDPAGTVYTGGKTAAPVFKAILEGALASRENGLDRDRIAQSARPPRLDSQAVAPRESLLAAGVVPDTGDIPFVINVGEPTPAVVVPPMRAVPEVRGLPLRRAVLALHQAGFKVELATGPDGTDPVAGTLLRPGRLVKLQVQR